MRLLLNLKLTFFYFSILLSFAAQSCGSDDLGGDPKKIGAPSKNPSEKENALQPKSACKQGTALTYENFGRDFIVRYCSSCHSENIEGAKRSGTPKDVNFDTLEDVHTWRSRILARSVADTSMPPFNLLGNDERKVFGEWIKCGAP